jgi:non-lysosomal glucosylceramidase
MKFFAQTVDWEDPAYKSYLYAEVSPGEVPQDKKGYYWNVNKVRGMVPHDIGSPLQRPWVVLNAFDWQNGNVWKDLNPKFPLRALRDYRSTGSRDREFLKKMFRASVSALDTLERKFGDPQSHVPLNEGIPDQTYDTWRMKGESAMVGLLWLGALRATAEMGEELASSGAGMLDDLDVNKAVSRYTAWFESGRQALEKLWDDEAGYFHIDAHTDDIMTDQLFGVWYAAMTGVETTNGVPIVPEDRVRRALRTIYEKNVLGYGGGLLGAVNGRSAAGAQLRSQQGDEVWVGTAYAFASNCILHGMKDEGMHTAYGVFHTTYTPFGQGYFFKSPEAYLNPDELVWNNPGTRYGETLFRVMKYMRPGAVWAVYEALLKKLDR